jgi:asparagine synthase (glutamine-hydrolysing)
MQKFLEELYDILEESTSACKARTLALSGGLDSSILAYFLKEKRCNAISISTEDFIATDLTFCQLVAKKFNLKLEMKIVSIENLLSAIEETIKILKVFNDIEIRNSVVIYLALKSVKENGQHSIITGDGADELFAGYNFFLKKNDLELQKDLERIWKIMHFPSKKIGQELGITVETPFLDKNVVDFAKNIPVNLKVREKDGKKYGKWILRKAFEDKLPQTIVWRDKSPMQDGAGTTGLTHLFNTLISDNIFNTKFKQIQESDNVSIQSKESLHYYEIYRKYFEPPYKLHSSNTKCPNCQFEVKYDSKFCIMCGSFPI